MISILTKEQNINLNPHSELVPAIHFSLISEGCVFCPLVPCGTWGLCYSMGMR